MKFVAISDTHDNLIAVRDLVEQLKKEKIDFIVHAGDVIAPFTLKEFFPLNVKMYIAFGNNDGEKKLLKKISNEKNWEIGEIVEFPEGIVYHGTDSRIVKILKKCEIEYLVLGHTHEPLLEKGKVTVINPGEVCGYLTGKRTYAICEDGEISILEV